MLRWKSLALWLALFCCLFASAHARPRQTEPSLLKRTINVTLKRYLRHWKNPAAAEPVYNTWSWVPLVSFAVNGPLPGGSQVYVEFDTPEGKPWLRHNMHTPTVGSSRVDLQACKLEYSIVSPK